MTSPDQVLFTRDQLVERLVAHGFPIKRSYFDKLCLPKRKGGPPIAMRYGVRPLYRLDDALAWAEARCGKSAEVA